MNDLEDLAQAAAARSLYKQIGGDFLLKRWARQTATYLLLYRLRLSLGRTERAENGTLTTYWYRNADFYTSPVNDKYKAAWDNYARELGMLVADVAAALARMALVVIPDWYQVHHADWAALPQSILAEFGRRHGFPVIDVLAQFRQSDSPEQPLYRDPETDGHLTRRGNRLLANTVSKSLFSAGLVPRCTS